VKVVKNKLAPPFQVAEFDIRYGIGIDATADLLDLAVTHGLVEKNGSYFSFSGQSLGQGREKARLALCEDAALRASVANAVHAAMAGSQRAPGTPELDEAVA
jgi:recombination protein RecA